MGSEGKWLLARISDRSGGLIGTFVLALEPPVEHRAAPWLLYVDLPYAGRPLPTGEEFDAFDEFDLALQALLPQAGAHLVAIWTAEGRRSWICYSVEGERAAKALREGLDNWLIDVEVSRDRKWRQYADLQAMAKDATLGSSRRALGRRLP
ncbi:MAG: DUF695 domain-containing protein [Chthonomonadaceae bacterium]|nr:DUF695 domain-containing protein [Chthonomonadaceae bacterium]